MPDLDTDTDTYGIKLRVRYEIGHKTNVDLFSKTMEQNVFKLCMIVTSHEHYIYTLLLLTFVLYLGHRDCNWVKWAISVSQELLI